jgi:hypothetical protein
MNGALKVVFVTFTLILIFVIIWLTNEGTNNLLKERKNIIIPNTNRCVVPFEQLINLDTSQDICCLNNGRLTGAYYINVQNENMESPPIEMSVIPVQTYYIDVCRAFCTNTYTVNRDGTLQCNDEMTPTETILANTCVDLIRPQFINGVPCRGSSMPIARLGITNMFALNVKTANGIAQCQTRRAC